MEKEEGGLAAYAQRRLTRLILDRELAGGAAVVEERLAEELAISRTPLREALARLEAEGLLVKNGQRSYQVRSVSASEFFQCMRLREILETEAVELAIGRAPPEAVQDARALVEAVRPGEPSLHPYWAADDAFHELFSRHCGNGILARVVREMRITARLFEASSPFKRAVADREEHLAVLDAFQADDAKGARRAMARHIRNLQRDVMHTLRG